MRDNEIDRPAPSLGQRRIFITGANGFIGRAMAERFRALGAEVAGVDLGADVAGNVVAGDITKPRSTE
jgi:nucleoside-diphosphate-sugar epimerase